MKFKQLILTIFLTLTIISCNSQNKETYWEITNIYREDKEEFKGLTGYYMQEILDNNFHFIKKNDNLYFELPEKFNVNLKDFKSLEQIKIKTRNLLNMYDFVFSGQTFKIKFKDEATFSNSKNTIIEFSQISKEKFENDIKEELAYAEEVKQKINTLKSDLVLKSQIKLNEIVKLPLKKDTIQNDKGQNIVLKIPQYTKLKESGDIKNQVFDAIKIGTFKDYSKIYDFIDPENDYGLSQLTVWVSTDQANFDIEDYVNENTNNVILKKENNYIVGYQISYDFNTEKAVANSLFCLKYYKIDKSHVFIYSDIYLYENGKIIPVEKVNKILNFNHLISQNIIIENK
ncbi:hypothetical protein NLG42_09235 [Flavobacterium plurextorum]|uniref:hypothetical protein n=1 Tax=Flavobacterium TaxID=237 RepID=UPI00214DB8D8|nr:MULTISPECIES: hypothetical protein [Flavobacterium]UUW10984.1 hypothetical protein NLG42_09235 [Flavobacterium plurextorum]